MNKETTLSNKRRFDAFAREHVYPEKDVKIFVKWCIAHSHMCEDIQVIAISKFKEGVGDKLTK